MKTKKLFQIVGIISRSNESVSGDYSIHADDICWEQNVDGTTIETFEEAKDIFIDLCNKYTEANDWFGDLTLYLRKLEVTLDEDGDVEDVDEDDSIASFQVSKYLDETPS